MNNSVNNTLLALLLAVKNLETPLTQEEDSISLAAEQLCLDPNPEVWEDTIEPELQKMIKSNTSLDRLFQSVKAKLETLKTNIPHRLIPTEAELEIVVPPNPNHPKKYPVPQIFSTHNELINNELTNMALRVMSTPETSTAVKQLSRLEQIWEFLNQPIGQQ